VDDLMMMMMMMIGLGGLRGRGGDREGRGEGM
jgi:hypothetical protein